MNKVVTTRTVSAKCTPPNQPGYLPEGVEGRLWKERDLYLFRYYEGYTSAVPKKFVELSSAFKPATCNPQPETQ